MLIVCNNCTPLSPLITADPSHHDSQDGITNTSSKMCQPLLLLLSTVLSLHSPTLTLLLHPLLSFLIQGLERGGDEWR